MIKINVLTDNIGWNKYIKNPIKYFEKKLGKFNKNNKKLNKNILFFTLLLSGNQYIRNLNKKFRKKNSTTDILSFPFYNQKELKKKLQLEKEIYLGDIIINLNKIKFKKKGNFEEEFDKLWIHGFVHLFGHDHKKDKDYLKMEKIEKKFLAYVK